MPPSSVIDLSILYPLGGFETDISILDAELAVGHTGVVGN